MIFTSFDDIPRSAYGLIYADPPWLFQSNSAKRPGRNPKRHYQCLPLDVIAAFPVADIAATDAVLLMWTTAPFAEKAFDVMRAWGFSYKSQIVWDKINPATGMWAAGQHELLYLGTRGKPPVRPKGPDGKMLPAPFARSLISRKKSRHSQKPVELIDAIDAARQWRNMARIELFSRQSRHKWDSFGNEVAA